MDKEASIEPSNSSGAEDQEEETVKNEEQSEEKKDSQSGEEAQDDENRPNGASVNKKDPSRPKRKKARRACFACQRAHLTCGDERPCQRCVKRGLADQCQDGARKKAKYLHDAPPEALLPGNIYTNPSAQKHALVNQPQPNGQPATPSQPLAYTHHAPTLFPAQQMLPSSAPDGTYQDPSNFNPFNTNPSPISSHYSNAQQQQSPMSNHMPQAAASQPSSTYNASMFDSGEPNVFGFDLASMNFGNQYGALEFGMLEKLSSSATESAARRPPNGRNRSSSMTAATGANPTYPAQQGYDGSFIGAGGSADSYAFRNDGSVWQTSGPSIGMAAFDQDMSDPFRRTSHAGPHAYAIGAGPGSLSGQSPGSSGTDILAIDSSNFLPSTAAQNPAAMYQSHAHQPQQRPPTSNFGSAGEETSSSRADAPPSASISQRLSKIRSAPPNPPSKRQRNPGSIYTQVTKPYPYTLAFHALTAVLQRRFSPQKRLRIAQALASIRPSFISCTRNLIEEDLVFMERCFLRGLWDYEDFSSACGTPTIICRRTGEVAHVGKEFTLLTGWTRDVLLGKVPNQNVNLGGGSGGGGGERSDQDSKVNTTGLSTPRHAGKHSTNGEGKQSSGGGAERIAKEGGEKANAGDNNDRVAATGQQSTLSTQPPSGIPTPGRTQPVFLAELLDDDSVIQFYEDYAKLAFADSKGSAWSPCKLLKYRTDGGNGNGTSGGGGGVASLLGAAGGNTDKTNGSGHGSRGNNDDAATLKSEGQGAANGGKKGGGWADERERRKAKDKSGRSGSGNGVGKMAGPMIHAEEAMQKMGDRDGKVDCVYCWMVKRDVFNIPMMIVINFLPIIN